MNYQRWPRIAAAKGLHEKVLSVMTDLAPEILPRIEGLEALDFPCGAGNFSEILCAHGCKVTSADIELNADFYGNVSAFVKADGNDVLPFFNEYFDVVVSIEGIEHLENPSFFLREVYRILKIGGVAIVTTPNVDSYLSKVNNLLKGYPRHFSPKSPSSKDSGHLLPCDILFMRGAAEKAGFKLLGIEANPSRKKPSVRSKLFQMLIARRWQHGLGDDVPLFGENLVYIFQRT